jgi:hypothetical protein
MSSLFDSYEKEFKRNLVPFRARALLCVRHVLCFLQLFMNERVDKLNSLTGSGLATCLQEAEESVLLCIPSPFLLISLILPLVEGLLRHPRENGLRGKEHESCKILPSFALNSVSKFFRLAIWQKMEQCAYPTPTTCPNLTDAFSGLPRSCEDIPCRR